MNDERRDHRGRQRGAARATGRQQKSQQAPSQRASRADSARLTAYELLRQVRQNDAYANLVLPVLIRESRLGTRDAAFATELAYGTLRWQGRYDAVLQHFVDRPLSALDPGVLDVLRLGAHQILSMRVPAHAAVSQSVAVARMRTGAGSAQLVNAVLRRLSQHPQADDLIGTDDPVTNLSQRWSHPEWIVRALEQSLRWHGRPAAELVELLEADNTPPEVTLVARPGLISRAELLAQTGEAGRSGELTSTAVVLSGGDPARLPAVREGLAAVQDEGSQLVALVLTQIPVVGADSSWLDLCAGPGGKSALLGAVATTRLAHLVANEVTPHRAELVVGAVRALDTVEVRTGDGREIGTTEPQQYDRVLVDAPCTGLGALRRRPESRWRRTPADLSTLSGLQRELLDSALQAVRVGGVVGYVTCSPHIAETKVVVDDAIRAAQRAGVGVELVDLTQPAAVVTGTSDHKMLSRPDHLQLWPHVHHTDAMSLIVLRRTS